MLSFGEVESLKDLIRAEANRLGFPRCGFAPVEAPPHADFVRSWLADGNAGEMPYIERGLAKRLDPRLISPSVRSVISLAYRYPPAPLPPVGWQQQLRGRIAAYALGADYHTTIGAKLRALADYIGKLRPGARARIYVDTGPVLEREWASQGGIGWFGKNTNLLHTHDGSCFFLGEILTDLEFDPDPLLRDHCGTCTRCLDRCPTGALRPGYGLDARLCISYLTIEHRGIVPAELRAHMGHWIFGCDICQEVCPWNERFNRGHEAPDNQVLLPYLPEILLLTEDAFRRRFHHTAMWRTRRVGLARNAAIALGNTANPAAVPVLREALRHDPAPLVRAHAAWALGAIGNASARQELESARATEADDSVRGEIDAALAVR